MELSKKSIKTNKNLSRTTISSRGKSCGVKKSLPKNAFRTGDNDEEPIEPATFFGEPSYKVLGQYDFKPSIAFDILIAVTIVVQAYLYIKYAIILQDPESSSMFQYNALNIFFCVVGRYVYDAFRQGIKIGKFFEIKNGIPRFINYRQFTITDVIGSILIFVLVITTQTLRFVKLNVTNEDAFLFYVFSAPAEEVFFRYFMTSVLIIIPLKIFQKIKNDERWKFNTVQEVILKASVGFLTGILFGLAHGAKYEGMDLVVILLNGIEFSVIYAFMRRIDVVLFSHLALNIRAGWDLVF